MKKRDFLAAALLGSTTLPALAAQKNRPHVHGTPVLLTVGGDIGQGNRKAFDPALDQLMKKQGVSFNRAHGFDFAALSRLTTVTIHPTLEYDGRVHALSGPLITDVLLATNAKLTPVSKIVLRAIDGYAVETSIAQLRQYRYIAATHLDGQPMALGGLGPLFAVYDADRFPDKASLPLADRFGGCPWGLYYIGVQAG